MLPIKICSPLKSCLPILTVDVQYHEYDKMQVKNAFVSEEWLKEQKFASQISGMLTLGQKLTIDALAYKVSTG